MSMRDRSNCRRCSCASAASSTASCRGGASSASAISPVGRTSTAPTSSSLETAVVSLDCERSVSSWTSVGARVRHDQWGEGAVQRYESDSMTVLFDDVGYKTLARSVVSERGLLEPA